MGKAYSDDLRIRIVRLVEDGHSRREAADLYEVSASSAIRWSQLWDTTGSVSPSARKARRRKLDPYGGWLLEIVKAEPDIRLIDIQAQLAEQGMKISIGHLWNFYDAHGISFKKNRARQRAGAA